MTPQLREFQTHDRPHLRQLYLDSRRERFLWTDRTQFALEDFDAATEGETILVALEGEIPIGFVAWWPPENFIHSLFIHPAYQRRGIGTALLSACLSQIDRPAQLKCCQSNTAALAFYRSQGWTVDGEGVSSDGEAYYLMTHP